MADRVEAPWGTYELDGVLAWIKQFQDQIQYFIDTGQTDNVQYAKRDIQGYQLILDSGSQDNARKFLEIKQNERLGDEPKFADNIAIVEYMKSEGLWK